jgi:ABC-type transport system substrate-binding protein
VLDAHKDTMTEVLSGVGNTVFMSLNNAKPPFDKDPRLIKAMYLAFDRQAAIQTFHQGLGQVSGPVPWLQEGFALPLEQLRNYGGYKTDHPPT